MSEVLNDQNEERTPRPIGRFLLGLEDYSGEQDPMAYAADFAHQGKNFQKYRHKTAKVEVADEELTIDGRKVQLEFMISKFAYIWKIIVFAEKHKVEDLSTGYVPHGGEKYELYCSSPKSHAKYYEYGSQGNAIREREFDTPEELRMLQGVIERLITGPDQ